MIASLIAIRHNKTLDPISPVILVLFQTKFSEYVGNFVWCGILIANLRMQLIDNFSKKSLDLTVCEKLGHRKKQSAPDVSNHESIS